MSEQTTEQAYEASPIPTRTAGVMFAALAPKVCVAYLMGGPEAARQILNAAALALAVDVTRQLWAIDHHPPAEPAEPDLSDELGDLEGL